MKKFLAVIILLTLVAATACSTNDIAGNNETTTPTENTTATELATAENSGSEIDEIIEQSLSKHNFEGVVYLTKNGEVVYQSATGKIDDKEAITIDTSLPVGSVSKQFCATAILMLRDQGKLSVDDTLSEYFPEYEIGKDITLKNMLSMRSGIPDMVNEGTVEDISADKSEEANTEAIKSWIFSQELNFEPDSAMGYSNSNYFLLGNIVEQVSGQKYMDFVRENIFEPLGMNNTGFIEEIKNSPDWANGVSFDSVEDGNIEGLTKGAGDIVSNASDMDKWMTGLRSGKVISLESYQEMTTNYVLESAAQYGYGLTLGIYGGVGHSGAIGTYVAYDYFNEEQGYNLFMASNNIYPPKIDSILLEIVSGISD